LNQGNDDDYALGRHFVIASRRHTAGNAACTGQPPATTTVAGWTVRRPSSWRVVAGVTFVRCSASSVRFEEGALKMLDVKMTDQLAGHEIAGHENAGMK